MPKSKDEYTDNKEKDYKIIIASESESDNGEETVIMTAEKIQEISEHWMYDAMQSFEKGGRQYSVRFNEDATSASSETTIKDIKELALNAQSDIYKIRKINILVRQAENEDDIIGKVHEAIEANLNANVTFSFDELPNDYDESLRKKAEDTIKRFHKEVNINEAMTTAITSTYDEGNCIQYLRTKKYKNVCHHVIDKYPLGVALISDYSINGIPNILVDTSELSNRLQKTTLKSKKNKPLFFANTTEEIKSNYPKEVIDAFVNKEKYAILDIKRTGVNRFGNLGRAYGVSPVFKALKPKIMLDTFDNSDTTNAKAKSKKIIAQIMRKETMGNDYSKKGFEDMAYAHSCLIAAWANPTVVYTPPPCVEKIEYVEPKAELTNENKIKEYRSRVTSALGISFLNTDGQQTVSTANVSIKQLMKTINKIAERQEVILQRWYEIVLTEEGIPIEYCPTPNILDAELLEFDMKKDLAEFLYSKLNCSFRTAYETLGISYENEKIRREKENKLEIEKIFIPHSTSFNSSGNSSEENNSGRPKGSTENGNEVNDSKTEYDENYQKSKV